MLSFVVVMEVAIRGRREGSSELTFCKCGELAFHKEERIGHFHGLREFREI